MATGDPHNLGFGGCWCGGNHGMTLTERSYANGYRDGKAEDYDALRARHAALVEAAQEGLDIFGDGDGHSTEYVDHQWRCTEDCRAHAWLARLRAALASEEK